MNQRSLGTFKYVRKFSTLADSADSQSGIFEVKGSWNPQVMNTSVFLCPQVAAAADGASSSGTSIGPESRRAP